MRYDERSTMLIGSAGRYPYRGEFSSVKQQFSFWILGRVRLSRTQLQPNASDRKGHPPRRASWTIERKSPAPRTASGSPESPTDLRPKGTGDYGKKMCGKKIRRTSRKPRNPNKTYPSVLPPVVPFSCPTFSCQPPSLLLSRGCSTRRDVRRKGPSDVRTCKVPSSLAIYLKRELLKKRPTLLLGQGKHGAHLPCPFRQKP